MTTIRMMNKSLKLTEDEHLQVIAAVHTQLVEHVAPMWDRREPVVLEVTDPSENPGHSILVCFDDADQANALGYHEVDPVTGQPYGKYFYNDVMNNGGQVLTTPMSVSVTASHEACEMFVDPACNRWADINGQEAVALEVCDPVESGSYEINGVSVSDFLTPMWFDPSPPPGVPYNYLNSLANPFQMASGGYQVVETEAQQQQQFARLRSVRWDPAYPEWKKETKTFEASRTYRRLNLR